MQVCWEPLKATLTILSLHFCSSGGRFYMDYIWTSHPYHILKHHADEWRCLIIYLFIHLFLFPMCVCVSVCALSHIYAGTHPHVHKGQRSTLVVCFYSFLPFGLFLTHWLWSSLIGWLDWLTTSVSQGCCCLYLPRAGIIGTHHHGC